jgi:hypothetical protein
MRRATLAFTVVFAAGLCLLLALGLLEQRSEAFTLGVEPALPLKLSPGAKVCQRSIEPPAGFSRVRLEVVSKPGPAPRFDVRILSRGRQVAGNPALFTLSGERTVVVTVGDVPAGGRIDVCVENTGRRAFQVLGNSGLAHPPSAAYRGEKQIDYDLGLVFLRRSDTSLLSLAGDMVERASLFRGEWIGAWAVWVVTASLLTAFPLLLYRALRAAESAETAER